MSRQIPQLCRGKNWILFGATCVLLAACGGGGSTADLVGTQSALIAGPGSTETTRRADLAALKRSAALSSADLAAAEQQALAAEASAPPLDALQAGQIAALSDYKSGAVARKALAVRIPVYRFFNASTGAHFFTSSSTERDNVVSNLSPPFNLDGEAFSVASAFSPGLSPVHRFYNTLTGVHFYTISEAERANVIANFPQFNEEGVAYHASLVAGAGLTPFYRFFVPSKGFHFYTASEAEKDSIVANQSALYTLEGIGYYVLASDWQAEKLPHTGITSNNCFAPDVNFLVNCFDDFWLQDALRSEFNAQQDGHRATINPMTYSTVGSQPLTSCVKDEITGLIWEGKEPDGLRAFTNLYTHLNNGLATDTSGYVSAVNASNLCGFSDWRVPTNQELVSIVDYGRAIPSIATSWFPYTAAGDYRSVEPWSNDPFNHGYIVRFSVGYSGTATLATGIAVRLVRGSSFSGPRYSYSTVAYPGDGANNAVNDALTGLQWRRCEQGRVWSGSACTGTHSTFTHDQALRHAQAQSGWRLPNIKELTSLTDLTVSGNADAALINPTAFPGAESRTVWASSPFSSDNNLAWIVDFDDASTGARVRGNDYILVRLVRFSP